MSNDKKSINKIDRGNYTLLLSYNPCDLFTYFNVTEMHGLNAIDCAAHKNTIEDAYIAGLCNFIPKESGEYTDDDPRFVFINLSKCTDSLSTFALIMHELLHQSFALHKYDVNKEEEIITWAENESHQVYQIITQQMSNNKQQTAMEWLITEIK
jgi:hypothetical protein